MFNFHKIEVIWCMQKIILIVEQKWDNPNPHNLHLLKLKSFLTAFMYIKLYSLF